MRLNIRRLLSALLTPALMVVARAATPDISPGSAATGTNTPSTPILQQVELSQPACRPGFGIHLTYRWNAIPLGKDVNVFVHIRDASSKLISQDDHTPPVPTSRWSGQLDYQRTFMAPPDLPFGEYRVIAGLWDPKAGSRLPLNGGPGLKSLGDHAFEIARFRVTPDAPLPALPKPSLDLRNFRLTFAEEFSTNLSVSAWGPGTRWIAHTPYAGDFGDARFADPVPGFPFTITNGVLNIEARKTDDHWRSGLLSSADPNGNGFSQQYGYFEMRAKLPPGPGTWPAFWLLGVNKLKDKENTKSITQIEIDVVEQYGAHPNALHTTVHLWGPDKKHSGDSRVHIVQGMTDDFHTYGVLVDPVHITFYFDGVELRRCPTPEPANVPLYILLNLALGSGWPIEHTPSPSIMQVDYVRAYAIPPAP